MQSYTIGMDFSIEKQKSLHKFFKMPKLNKLLIPGMLTDMEILAILTVLVQLIQIIQ